MTESVTDIIVARSRSQERLSAMIVWSVGLHAALIAGILFAPAAKEEAPRAVMSISLSGAEGPRTEGLTQAAPAAVREVTPPQAKPVPVTPPRERPEMTLPDPKARPAPRARATTEAPAAPAPTTAPAPTRVRGQGFGVSSSGGRGLGGVQVDAQNFCCQEYLIDMVAAIKMRWNDRQSVVGSNMMKFTILRDGTIRDIQVERSSGFAVLDAESQHALLATAKLAALPAAYPNQTLTVHLRFDY